MKIASKSGCGTHPTIFFSLASTITRASNDLRIMCRVAGSFSDACRTSSNCDSVLLASSGVCCGDDLNTALEKASVKKEQGSDRWISL